MKNTALITGPTNGIGYELALVHARHGGDLVLVGRSLEKLQKVKTEIENRFQVKVEIIQKDLSEPNSAELVFEEVNNKNIRVDILINNAGFGSYGLFQDSSMQKVEEMINLNILNLTKLTRLFLPKMLANNKGKIMNVASTASFQPGPLMAVYFATKAYVLHFSEAISNELQGTGITVTVLCPGPTQSGFQDLANMQESKMIKDKKLPTARTVAEYGYKAMQKGQVVAIHGMQNFILANLVRFIPRSMVLKIIRKISEK